MKFANAKIQVEDYFEVKGVRFGCFDSGYIGHDQTSYPFTEHILAISLTDLVSQLDARRKESERYRCKSCGRGSLAVSSVTHVHQVRTTSEITIEQRIKARERLARMSG